MLYRTTVQHMKLVADAALTCYNVFTSLMLAFLTRPLQMLLVYQLSYLSSESATVQVYKNYKLLLKYIHERETSYCHK